MAKKLDTDRMKRELEGSAFFSENKEPATEVKNRRVLPNTSGEVKNRSKVQKSEIIEDNVLHNQNTDTESNNNVLNEMKTGRVNLKRRVLKRYSFEIYEDQIDSMEDLQFRYKKKTGNKLSQSRLIRDALDRIINESKDIK